MTTIKATTKAKHPTKHWLHLVLTILTAGAWLPVWIIVWLYNSTGMHKDKSVTRTEVPEQLSNVRVIEVPPNPAWQPPASTERLG